MTKQATPKQIPISEVHAGLVLPGATSPVSRNSLYLRLGKLGIKPVMKVPETGSRYPVGFVTEAEAEAIRRDFETTHWRKFKKAAELKKG